MPRERISTYKDLLPKKLPLWEAKMRFGGVCDVVDQSGSTILTTDSQTASNIVSSHNRAIKELTEKLP